MTRALLFIFIAATTISRSGFITGEAVESDNLVWGATASEVVTKLKIVPSSDRQSFLEEQVGLIEPYLSPNRVAVRKEMMDDKGLSTGAYHLVIVVAYNTKMVSKEELPKKYEELADRRWKGRLHVDPDDVDWFDSLAGYWGEKKAIAFMRQLSMLQPDLRIGKTLSAQLLGAGEFGIAPYLNGYRIAEMKAQGAPVDFLLMEPVFSKPRVVFLAKHAPHPHAAILFLDWIISEEAQTLIGQKLGRDPVRKGLKSKYERLDYPKYIVTRESLGPIYKKRLKQYHELIGYR